MTTYYAELNSQDMLDPALTVVNQIHKSHALDIGRLQQQVATLQSGAGTSSGGSVPAGTNFADAEVPAGSTGTVFMLAHTPSPAASLLLFWDGLLRRPGSGYDYTISNDTITTSVSIDPTAVNLLAYYRY